MGKWLDRLQEKMCEPAGEALTKLTKGGFVSNGSDPVGVPRVFLEAANASVVEPLDATQTRARPYRLTKAEGDAAHAVAWDDAAIERFTLRVGRLVLAGFHADDADDLAERLHLRDVEPDDRRNCFECDHLRQGKRCGNVAGAGRMVAELVPSDVWRLRHCTGFAPM